MNIYLERQYDPERRTMTLVASTGFGGDRRAVVVRDVDPPAARAAWKSWQALYREAGAEVHT